MTPEDLVTYASLLAGTLCFLLYLAFSVLGLVGGHPAPEKSFHAEAKHLIKSQAVDIGQFTDILKALAQLSDSLSKAAPSLVALIGAILFFTIAAISSGALHSVPPAKAASAAEGQGKGATPAAASPAPPKPAA